MNDKTEKTHIYKRMDLDDPQWPIVLVGLMGVGKSTVGRRLAARLDLPFIDADVEIEQAAGRTISEIFDEFGEAAFRDGERRVLARLLNGCPRVIATGGGAFVDESTRKLVLQEAVSIWLDADIETLVERTSRRDTRPLLQRGDPRATLERLMEERAEIYAMADIHIASDNGPHDRVVDAILKALEHDIRQGVRP